MFEDGEAGVKAGLSAAKWMRMAKVSKPTATRDLEELVAQGAIVSEALGGPETRYRLATPLCEPIEGINEGINEWLLKLVTRHPGTRLPYLKSVVRIVRFDGWQNTTTGRNSVKRSLRDVIMIKYRLRDQDLFNKAYAYVEQYY